MLIHGVMISAVGKRGFRFTTAAGFGLIGALIGWALLVDLVRSSLRPRSPARV